jgi:hypothetical protein
MGKARHGLERVLHGADAGHDRKRTPPQRPNAPARRKIGGAAVAR